MQERDIFFYDEIAPRQFMFLAKELEALPGTCFFFSGSSFETAQKSFLWAFPWDSLIVEKGTIERRRNSQSYMITPSDLWQALQEEMERKDPYSCMSEWFGYISYEMGAYSNKKAFTGICNAKGVLPIADACFARACFKAELDHRNQQLTVVIDHTFTPLIPVLLYQELLALTKKKIEKILRSQHPQRIKSALHFSVVQPFESAHSFCQKIGKIKEHITSGDVYQLNLSSEIILSGFCDPFSFFQEVVCREEASFFAFLRFSTYSIISASPERFLRRTGDLLESRPIKGTKARLSRQNLCPIKELESSEKELSELAMIVDLIRNDMARVSHAGSVEVKKFSIEEYKHLVHRLAVVQARSKKMHAVEVLKNAFPAGSITGCPKAAAMNFIYDLEKRRRGIYTGAIGYICPNGDFDFSVAIRTAVLQNRCLSLAAGSGIVIDSNPLSEYEELLTKAKSLLEPLTIQGCIS